MDLAVLMSSLTADPRSLEKDIMRLECQFFRSKPPLIRRIFFSYGSTVLIDEEKDLEKQRNHLSILAILATKKIPSTTTPTNTAQRRGAHQEIPLTNRIKETTRRSS